MQMNIKEAYAKATPGPLEINPNDEGLVAINSKLSEGCYILVADAQFTQHHGQQKINAALLAHAYNVLPEVLEALVQLEQALQHIENAAHQETPYDERAMKACFDEDRAKARAIIAKASEVKV